MITHGNLVTAIGGCNQYLESFNETLGANDSYLSFLPLAHVFDRCTHIIIIGYRLPAGSMCMQQQSYPAGLTLQVLVQKSTPASVPPV